MAGSERNHDVRTTELQEEFRDAGNPSVVQPAGATLGKRRAPIPMPGGRLTGNQAEREIGRDPDQHKDSESNRAVVKEMEERKASKESGALRVQYSGDAGSDTDSNLEAGKTQARVEGLIGNPD